LCCPPLAASPIAIELAQQALALRPGSYALVVSTEIVTQSIYKGTQRSMQVANVLFRWASSAVVMLQCRALLTRACARAEVSRSCSKLRCLFA
jgi:3-ketoacyl-CoA synthase